MNESEEEIELRQYSLKDLSILKMMEKYMKPYLGWFLFILLFDILVCSAFTLEPLISRALYNHLDYALTAIKEGTPLDNPMQKIYILLGCDFAIWMFAGFGAYFVEVSLKKIGQNVVRDIRNEMFSKVLSLSLSQLRSLKIGSYVTRITNDTQNISTFFSDILPQFFRALLTLLLIIVTTFVMEGYFGFVFLAFIPIVFLISYYFRKKAKKYYRANKKAVSQMNSFLSESFQGIKVIKTNAKENKKLNEFDKKNNDIYTSFLHSQTLFAFFYPLMYLLQMVCVLIIIGMGVPLVGAGLMLSGDFYMIYVYSVQFFQPVQQITQLINQLQSIITSAERVSVVLAMDGEEDMEKQNKDETALEKIDVPSFKGKIEFRHVFFAYEKDDYILKDVSFIINPGETVAFVGATGAGKSTIISLISRTYEINSGEILIDDVPLQDYKISCLRRNIGVMLQDVFLFSGTIEDNISLGDKSVTHEEVEKACKEVGADTFITKLPDQYNNKVVQRGENFSAGQRQLISFARTLVYQPSLVLLDEATANIDTETEHLIQSSMEKMRSIGTMVIVAHRLSTIRTANCIYVVSHGRIKESGTHQELLKLHGSYYNLYRLQNMENSLSGKENESCQQEQ